MIKLFNVDWATNTAGPSPFNNERTEVFFKGCKKAASGNPCPGCFNTALWSDDTDKEHKPEDVAQKIIKYAPNKYITIGGGEPTDQLDDLVTLVKSLHEAGFHILMYSWQKLQDMLKCEKDMLYLDLLMHMDILVDGQYIAEERCYDDSNHGDGLLNSVGSGNQVVWDLRTSNVNQQETNVNKMSNHNYWSFSGYHVRDINKLELGDNDKLIYYIKKNHVENKVVYKF